MTGDNKRLVETWPQAAVEVIRTIGIAGLFLAFMAGVHDLFIRQMGLEENREAALDKYFQFQGNIERQREEMKFELIKKILGQCLPRDELDTMDSTRIK